MTAENPRTIDLTVELEATPEEVWQAIATGPGISSWLQPTTLEERAGGGFTFELPGGTKEGAVTVYDRPRRLVQETDWTPLAGGETAHLATEWLIEARSGSTSVLRMVMTGFGSGESWEREIDGMGAGMRAGLAALALYVKHDAAQAAVRELLAHRDDAVRARDAEAFVATYSAPAICFTMAPPLSRIGTRAADIDEWFDGWEGSVERKARDLRIVAEENTAFSHSLVRLAGTHTGGEPEELWFRESLGFRLIEGSWYIVHEHTSVPIAMDGSSRAGLALAP